MAIPSGSIGINGMDMSPLNAVGNSYGCSAVCTSVAENGLGEMATRYEFAEKSS